MAKSKSRSTSRARKTSKSPARAKKTTPKSETKPKRVPSKSPAARSRSTSRGRPSKKAAQPARSPSKSPAKTVPKTPAKTPAKAGSPMIKTISITSRTSTSSAKRASTRSTSRPRISEVKTATVPLTTRLTETPIAAEIRQRVQRVLQAQQSLPTYGGSPTGSPKAQPVATKLKQCWFSGVCEPCDKVCSYVRSNKKDIAVSLFVFLIVGVIVYFILKTDPHKARVTLERFPGHVASWWKKHVTPKLKWN